MKADDAHASREVRKVAERAIRRLNVIEYVILGAAAVLALLAGALAALLLQPMGLPFRPTWAVASVAIFVVPAAVAYLRERKLERQKGGRPRADADPEPERGKAWPTRRS